MSAIDNSQSQLSGYVCPIIKNGPLMGEKRERDAYFFDSFYKLGDEIQQIDVNAILKNNLSSPDSTVEGAGYRKASKLLRNTRVIVESADDDKKRFFLGRYIGPVRNRLQVQFTKQHFAEKDSICVRQECVHPFSPISGNTALSWDVSAISEPARKKVSWDTTKQVKIVFLRPNSPLEAITWELKADESTYNFLRQNAAAKPGRGCKYPKGFNKTKIYHKKCIQIFMLELPLKSNDDVVEAYAKMKMDYDALMKEEKDSGKSKLSTRMMKFKLMLCAYECMTRGI